MSSLKKIVLLYLYLFLVWSIYHYFTRNPSWVDEMVVKPVIQLLPLLVVAFKIEKKNWQWLGWTKKELRRNMMSGLGVAIVLVLLRFVIKQFASGSIIFNPHQLSPPGFFLAFATSAIVGVVEETMFRGYFFQQLRTIFQNETRAMFLSSVLFMGNHIFYVIVISHYSMGQLFFYIAQLLLMGTLFALLFARTRSLVPSVAAHAVWNFSNALFL